jgi:hypothetical protein
MIERSRRHLLLGWENDIKHNFIRKSYLSIPRASVITVAKISPVSSAFNESNSLTKLQTLFFFFLKERKKRKSWLMKRLVAIWNVTETIEKVWLARQ